MDPRLDYLHDAEVASITFDGWPERSIRIQLAFHPDAGHPAVNGKRGTVELRDIWMSRYVQWPVHGKETLDRIRHGVPAELARTPSATSAHAVQMTFSFHSGAVLEVVCGELLLQLD
ncbi:MAG TPA: hypothetical protein VLX92_27745 [Kofleriaceae bacterium]|nr:hypothetical protein [Kofleriaceae bacterium]